VTGSNYTDAGKREDCYFCPTRHDLEEHHVIPQRFGGPDAPENIVTVCGRCHKKLERLYDAAFYEWFGIDDEKGERTFHRPCVMSGCNHQATRVMKSSHGYRSHVCENHAERIGADHQTIEDATVKRASHVSERDEQTLREIRSDVTLKSASDSDGEDSIADVWDDPDGGQ
jgi:hypothetical protein